MTPSQNQADFLLNQMQRCQADWQTYSASREQRIYELEQKVTKLTENLRFISDQQCELSGEYKTCADIPGRCITEFCLPCYAKAAIES